MDRPFKGGKIGKKGGKPSGCNDFSQTKGYGLGVRSARPAAARYFGPLRFAEDGATLRVYRFKLHGRIEARGGSSVFFLPTLFALVVQTALVFVAASAASRRLSAASTLLAASAASR